MNSYISYEEALKGINFWALDVNFDDYVKDPIKKNVIESVKNGSWIDKFCYAGHLVWFERQENLFSLEKGFLFEDFYANETFVVFVKFSSVSDWIKFLNVRLKMHLNAANSLTDFYEMMRTYHGELSKKVADDCHLRFSYYTLRSEVVEYLIEFGDFDKIKAFVSCDGFKDSYELHSVVRGNFDELFFRFVESKEVGKFLELLRVLIKEQGLKNFKLCNKTEKFFLEDYPEDYAVYQNLLKEFQ
ncbi:MAG: hypothetical protein IKW39_00200 [Alphaproteobacteria bacterium]|nr:hypothetical protein [Alphaproteobacteria bacterium]